MEVQAERRIAKGQNEACDTVSQHLREVNHDCRDCNTATKRGREDIVVLVKKR